MHDVGSQVLDQLVRADVAACFGVPGEQGIAFYDAVRRTGAVTHIGMRDERNLPYAAAAYARVAGRVAALDVTVGPGTAMLPVGLLEALHSATPMLVLASDVPVEQEPYAYRGALSQGMDQWGFLDGITKWRGKAWRPEHVELLVRRGLQEATGPVPGPAAVIIPQDVYNAPAAAQDGPPGSAAFPGVRPVPDAAELEAAARMVAGAHAPLLVAGGGVLAAGAAEEFTALARRLGAATATTLTGIGAVPDDYPGHLGVLGGIGTASAEQAAEQADVIVLVGYRSGGNSSLFWTFPRSGQSVIHLDLDPTAPGRYLPCDVALVGDAQRTLVALRGRLDGDGAGADTATAPVWDKARELHAAWLRERDTQQAATQRPLTPQHVLGALNGILADDDIVVSDASFASGWAALHTSVRRPGRRAVLPRGMAGLGFGLPAGIGAKVAAPDRQVWVVAGDGGFGYSLGELITLLHHGLNVNCLILNNQSWGWMDWGSHLRYGKEYFDLPDVSYAAMARGLGISGLTVNEASELPDALHQAAADDRACVVDVRTDLWQSPLLSHQRAIGGESS